MEYQIDPLDPNKIATEFIQANISNFVSAGKCVLKVAANKLRVHLKSTYKVYLMNIIKRHSKTKSFFIRDESVDLYKYYVPLSVATEQKKLDCPEIQNLAKLSPFSIVTGTAGSGKSMFMRHLLLSALKAKEKVPIYIELRELNKERINLREAIGNTLERNGLSFGDDYIEKALEAGHFVLLLDGFDELEHDKHDQAKREICSFAERYNKNWVVLASRPDSYLEGVHGFVTVRIQPLDVDQACTLIEKLPSEDELRDKFLIELRKKLFEKHKSFLSNPLLLTIMLLTYGENAEIPTKLNVFYNQAYEALFHKHDAQKGGYKRKRRSKLDIQDYATAFSAFSLKTYDKRAFQFSRVEALEYIDKARELTRLEYKSKDFLYDTLQAVCLMIEDGIYFTFTHRSFQEYFVARFIAQARPETQKRLVKRYYKSVRSDSVFELLYEICPEVVERNYILPEIERLKKIIGLKRKVGITHYTRYLKKAFKEVSVTIDSQLCILSNPTFPNLCSFTLRCCGHLVASTGNSSKNSKERENFFKIYGNRDIDIKKLTNRSPFVKGLAEHGGFLSLATLQRVFDIAELLEKRLRKTEASLEEIIG